MKALSRGWLRASFWQSLAAPSAAHVTEPNASTLEKIRSDRRFLLILGFFFVFGAGIRIIHFAQGRVLYNDELYVAANIRLLPFAELTGRLLHDQRAPLGFLLAVKACWVTLGHNDYSLRLVPLIGGLLGMVAFYPAARVFLPRGGALAAFALFAVNQPLNFYSAELKPYAWDALATTLVLGMLGRLANRPLTWRYAIGAGLLGLVMPFWSFSSTFTLAACGVALVLLFAVQRRWNECPRAALMGALWLVGIGAVHFIQVRHYSNDPKDIEGWIWVWLSDFAPKPGLHLSYLEWYGEHLSMLASNAVGLKSSGLAIMAACVGLLGLARTCRLRVALLLAPIGMGLVLAIAKFYPFAGRLLLYLYPVVMISIGAAIARLYQRGGAEGRRWAIGSMAILLLPMLVAGMRDSTNSRDRKTIASETYSQAHIKQALKFLKKNWQPGDVLYLHNDSHMWMEHYTEQYDLDCSTMIRGHFTGFWHPSWEGLGNHLARTVQGKPRVWVFISQQAGFAANETIVYRYYLDRMGRRLKSYDPGVNESGHMYLYDLTSQPSDTAASLTASK